MAWELIGGDPAPGSPDAVGSASAALRHVADIAAQARTDLTTQTGAAGIEHWKGSAADAFRADVQKLPSDLGTVSTSYGEAAGALTTFRTVLENAQTDARAVLAAAQQAKADRDAAESRRRTAQSEADALTISHLKAQASLTALQTQQTLSIDPAHRASLTTPITSAKTQVNRAAADLNSAKQQAATYARQVKEADGRLANAQERADVVRRTVAAAVGNAVAVLQQAERDAHLPSWLSEVKQKAVQDLQRYGPEVLHYLDIAQSVFSVLALIPTPLSGVFAGAALACGIGGLALSFAIDASRPGGLKGSDVFELSGRLLGVVAGGAAMHAAKLGAAGVTGATGLKSAETWSRLSTGAGWLKDVSDVGEGTVEHGWRGGVVAAGGILLGKGAELGVAKGATALAREANAVDSTGAFKHENVANFLKNQSANLRSSADGPNTSMVSVTRSDDVHTLQSLMATGRQSGGTFLPGNHGASGTGAEFDHTMSDKALDDALKDGTSKVVDMAETVGEKQADSVKEDLRHALGEPPPPPPAPREPDIDIDLTPSQYGSGG